MYEDIEVWISMYLESDVLWKVALPPHHTPKYLMVFKS
jgi:hypothetical protein